MFAFLIVIHILACIALIAIILLQAGRGGGLSESFGGGSVQTIFGTKTTNFLTRTTTIAAVIFLLTCLSLAILSSRRSRSLMEREAVRQQVMDIVETKTKEPIKTEEPVKTEVIDEGEPVSVETENPREEVEENK